MRFSLLTLSLLSTAISALPSSELSKRASVSDVGTGYSSLNGGTTGGKGGTTTTVSTYSALQAAVAGDSAKIVFVTGTITQASPPIKLGANTSVIGKGAKLIGFGLIANRTKNVIIRNVVIQKVLAENGDAISVQKSSNIWIDHVDVSSDLDHDKDYYDGLLDFTHAADYVTVSNSYIHDHHKASLVGHSDKNGAEDTGFLHVTYSNNYWSSISSRAPSLRFGTAHVYNSYFLNVQNAVETRDNAQVLVESNTWAGDVSKPIFSADGGEAVANDNDFGGRENSAPAGTLKSVSYKYTLLGSGNVKAAVVGSAGATLSF